MILTCKVHISMAASLYDAWSEGTTGKVEHMMSAI
jgi:hypothetical protein